MKEQIIKLSKKLNIDIIGFTKLENYEELKEVYQQQEKNNFKCSFQVGSIFDKTHLKEIYNEYNSYIVIGIGYNNSIDLNNKVHLSSFCFGKDYHLILREKLNHIGNLLENNNYKYKIFVDNNILDERYVAFKAGLGFYGNNNLLINEKLGSNFFIGIIMTDCIFEYDKSVNKKCLGCNKCINACPNNAITKYGINAKKCLSYITQKKNLTKKEEKLLNNCIYGCDICSNVCEYNQNKKSNNFKLDSKSIIKNFEEISEEKWNKMYKDTACYWRGREVINRNIKKLQEKLEK